MVMAMGVIAAAMVVVVVVGHGSERGRIESVGRKVSSQVTWWKIYYATVTANTPR
jgi:hypothetical protein